MTPAPKHFRWRWVLRRVAPALVGVLTVLGLCAGYFFMPFVPQPLGRRLTEGFLRAVLIGYAGGFTLGVAATAGLTLALLRARRRKRPQPWMAKLLLLSVSGLLGLAMLEAAAAAWLAWAHRMPVLPTRFARPSDPNEVSIVVIGGSSALGYPYDPTVSIGPIVAWQLEKATVGHRFVVDVRAQRGATLERMHQDLAGLTRRPDLLIVYSGNNEFQTRFDGGRDVGLTEAPANPALRRLYRVSLHSPLCRMIYETIAKNRVGGPAPKIVHPRLLAPPLCSPSEEQAIRADFRHRLEAIIAYARRVGAEPVIVIPPGSESGWEPSRSVPPDSVSARDRAGLTEAFENARALEESDPTASRARYESIVAGHPWFAEAHFRLARLLEAARDNDAARRHYTLARDRDGFPIRVTTAFAQIYRDVAARSGCILVDGPEVLRPLTPRGILDGHAIHDAHHPTLASHVALARAVLEHLRTRHFLGWRGDEVRVSPTECATHFGVDRETWEMVCAKSATFYRHFAHARYDPSERLTRMRRFEEAGLRIASGVPPERTGIAGLGIPTP